MQIHVIVLYCLLIHVCLQGFYLYLYIGSIIFLVYAYIFLLQSINLPTTHIKSKFQTLSKSEAFITVVLRMDARYYKFF